MGWECEGTTAFLREGIGQDCAGSAAPLSPIRPKASGPEVSGVDTAARNARSWERHFQRRDEIFVIALIERLQHMSLILCERLQHMSHFREARR